MDSLKSCKVIAICGSSSGVGKSTLVNKLSQLIPDSATLFFDSYHETTEYPQNLFKDLADSKNIDPRSIKSPYFYRDLSSLCHGKAIIDPWNREIKPVNYIILEEPFGRAREGMNELIDYVACINLPMDIALARRLLRNLKTDFIHLPTDERVSFLESTLNEYLNGGRIAYEKIFEFVSSDCDLLLDGLDSTDEMAQAVIMNLKQLKLLS